MLVSFRPASAAISVSATTQSERDEGHPARTKDVDDHQRALR
jgi:hypothetical protein